jgi:fumarate reductase flavoprotein subunit
LLRRSPRIAPALSIGWRATEPMFVHASPINWHRFTLGPPRAALAGQDWQGRGPDRMLGELRRRIEERQGSMLLGTRATALRIERGRCVGLVARRDDTHFNIDATAVVIADGGFPGNAALFRKYIGPRPDRVLMRHAGTAIGDGLKMAEAAGAAMTRLDRFYGHLLSRDAMDNPGLWPYPQIDAVATAAIVVDPDGKRLLDEGLGGISITNDLARLDDPLCTTVICDTPIWETAGKAAQIPPNPQLLVGGGTLHRADTLADLAEAAGLSGAGLAETVVGYNDAVRDRRLAGLSPPRSTRSGQPRTIEIPPFFAIPICAGITNTMGGIAIDGRGRIRRPDGTIIGGLYAAGGTTGGLEGGGALGYVGGLIKACVFGLRVAEDAARRR